MRKPAAAMESTSRGAAVVTDVRVPSVLCCVATQDGAKAKNVPTAMHSNNAKRRDNISHTVRR